MTELQDHCILITGGAGGIGAGIAQAILQQGGHPVLMDRDLAGAQHNAKLLTQAGLSANGEDLEVYAFACDVTDPTSVELAITQTLDRYDHIDGLVNNAGIIQMAEAWEATSDQWQSHFNVNSTGAFNMSQAVGKHMRDSDGGGAIVNVASNCGKVGYANMAAYNASKAAMISLTRSLAMEWAAHNINVNAVCPGGVNTNMLTGVADWLAPRIDTPADTLLEGMGAAQLGRKIEPAEVGDVVAFLLSKRALIIRGQAISTDGGDTPY